MVTTTVDDDCRGASPEDREQMPFARSYRTDGARARESGGTGLAGDCRKRHSAARHRGLVKAYRYRCVALTLWLARPFNEFIVFATQFDFLSRRRDFLPEMFGAVNPPAALSFHTSIRVISATLRAL